MRVPCGCCSAGTGCGCALARGGGAGDGGSRCPHARKRGPRRGVDLTCAGGGRVARSADNGCSLSPVRYQASVSFPQQDQATDVLISFLSVQRGYNSRISAIHISLGVRDARRRILLERRGSLIRNLFGHAFSTSSIRVADGGGEAPPCTACALTGRLRLARIANRIWVALLVTERYSGWRRRRRRSLTLCCAPDNGAYLRAERSTRRGAKAGCTALLCSSCPALSSMRSGTDDGHLTTRWSGP